MNIIGHQPIVKYFEDVIAHNNMAHCYLFSGPSHVGKTAVLSDLIQKLIGDIVRVDLENPEALASRYPDFYYLTVAEGKSEIAVDDVREFRSRLALGSFGGRMKVGVIYGAEALNASSANALLKLLEEPAPRTVLFLITDRGHSLLPTIKSRAVHIEFSLVSSRDMMSGLAEEASADYLSRAVKASCGKPGIAIRFLRKPEEFDILLEQCAKFLKLLTMPAHELISFFGEQEITDDFFEVLIAVLRDAMLWRAGRTGEIAFIDLAEHYAAEISLISSGRIASIIGALESIRTSPLYLNQELQLENTFISL